MLRLISSKAVRVCDVCVSAILLEARSSSPEHILQFINDFSKPGGTLFTRQNNIRVIQEERDAIFSEIDAREAVMSKVNRRR